MKKQYIVPSCEVYQMEAFTAFATSIDHVQPRDPGSTTEFTADDVEDKKETFWIGAKENKTLWDE